MLLSDPSSSGRLCSSACSRSTLWIAIHLLVAQNFVLQTAQADTSAVDIYGIQYAEPLQYPSSGIISWSEPSGSITFIPSTGIQGSITSTGVLVGGTSSSNDQIVSLPATSDNNWSTSGTLTVSGGGISQSGSTVTQPDVTLGTPLSEVSGTPVPVDFPQSPSLVILQFLDPAEVGSGISLSHATSRLVINGAHSNPLSRRVAEGLHNFWLAGDWGSDDHDSRDGDLGMAELGFAHNLGHSQLGVSLGQTWAQQNLSLGGQAKNRGTYLLFEAMIPVFGKLWTTVNACGQWGEGKLTRNYMNGALIESSTGTPDASSWGVRIRADLENAYRVSSADFSPYVSLSYSKAKQDGYAETGGSLPVVFNAIKAESTELSLGVNIAKPLNNEISLLGLLEGTHRFESEGASISGQINGLGNFGIAGNRIKRDWVRAMFGFNSNLAQGKATLSINITSNGEAPNVWLAVGWQRPF